ncbi:MAG TPA: N-acetylmuramoyl-L-alanine amidase [Armatimonadaceae bacterium]|nr:N-acetylmuramoyl-L-alanine amidase [Armatimonadaceae bacterium]
MNSRFPYGAALLGGLVLCATAHAAFATPQEPARPNRTGAAQQTPPPGPGTLPDTPWAVWEPALPSNYARTPLDAAPRTVDMVVIHDIEGTAQGCVRWFQDPRARASSHYVVDGETGKVWQMVQERDVAWHAGNSAINRRSVGIENHGYAYRPGFYDATVYESCARLVREVTARYGIPRDREHIIAHAEVPDPRDPTKVGGASHHTDPGPYWDWDAFMALVRNDAVADAVQFPAVLRPGERVTASVTLRNLGDDPWPVADGATGDENRVAFARREPVYLGVWPPPSGLLPPPGGTLRTPAWTSPRFAGLPTGQRDVTASTSARFAFPVQAPPYAGGSVTQRFRLFRVPVMPRSPVAFGPVVSATVRIDPWDLRFSAAQQNAFKAGADWRRNGGVYWAKAAPSAAAARWTAELPVRGEWDVYARWTAAAGRTARAIYEVGQADDETPVETFAVDQRAAPGGSGANAGWRRLGRVTLVPGKDGKVRPVVRLATGAAGTVVADAVRFVGPYAPADAL